jgi:hypothetical protein
MDGITARESNDLDRLRGEPPDDEPETGGTVLGGPSGDAHAPDKVAPTDLDEDDLPDTDRRADNPR